ncbi:MAG: acyl carrier protein [Syntrophales bacterium]|nr:acyl carrier protein [Syntrophales bacterium]
MSLEERVLKVLRKIFPEAKADSHIDNIEGWDSVNHLRCLLGLEEEFEIMFAPEEMEKMTSVKDMILVISEKVPDS